MGWVTELVLGCSWVGLDPGVADKRAHDVPVLVLACWWAGLESRVLGLVPAYWCMGWVLIWQAERLSSCTVVGAARSWGLWVQGFGFWNWYQPTGGQGQGQGVLGLVPTHWWVRLATGLVPAH